ncbi:MAG TPA: diaminopropionate ammonia-lyase, partial [Firmicutes bacterium]|nr:diaminopropionate ammonia-lyase [Bacillota bacterium]
ARLLFAKLGHSETETLTFDKLRPEIVRQKLGEITFTTATSGNHGRGVAWTAKQLGQKAVIYLPKGTAPRRVAAIEELGSRPVLTDLNYDDAVRVSEAAAEKNGWYLVQDTAWEGYEEIPRWIMHGYTTIAAEVDAQLAERGWAEPTNLFLQVGVGSFAASILSYFLHRSIDEYPKAAVVEPAAAACMFASRLAGTKEPQAAKEGQDSIMSGLACYEANHLAWEILRPFAQAFLIGPEFAAARGVRILANPLGSDPRIVAGESGAFATGLLSLLLLEEDCAELKEKLGLDENSVILLISTEGDTDPINYRRILWDGKYPLP